MKTVLGGRQDFGCTLREIRLNSLYDGIEKISCLPARFEAARIFKGVEIPTYVGMEAHISVIKVGST